MRIEDHQTQHRKTANLSQHNPFSKQHYRANQTASRNNKRHFMTASTLFISTMVFTALLAKTIAAEPNQIQVKDSVNPANAVDGVFNLDKASSSIVSMATAELIGHSPGIRTIATVNNTNGTLSICSTVQVNYQILDIDGDWDNPFNIEGAQDGQGNTYVHQGTKDSINWFVSDDDGRQYPLDLNELGGYASKITLPTQATINGEKRTIAGMKLGYHIKPYTMQGSNPYTFPTDDPVSVTDLSKIFYVPPEQSADKVEIFEPEFAHQALTLGTITFPGFGEFAENESFIQVATIAPQIEGESCVVANPNLSTRFKPAFVDEDNQIVKSLRSNRIYGVALLYDKSGDKTFTLEDEVSEELLRKGKRDIYGNLMMDGIRLQYWKPKDYVSWEREMALIREVTVGTVTKAGLPLYGEYSDEPHFGIKDNRLYVYTGGKYLIPELLWEHPAVQERFNYKREKAITVQGYILQVVFDPPEGDYEPYPEEDSTTQTDQTNQLMQRMNVSVPNSLNDENSDAVVYP